MCPSAFQARTECGKQNETHRAPRLLTTLLAVGGIMPWAGSAVPGLEVSISVTYGTTWHGCQGLTRNIPSAERSARGCGIPKISVARLATIVPWPQRFLGQLAAPFAVTYSKNGKSRLSSFLSGWLPYSQISKASTYLIEAALSEGYHDVNLP